MRVLHTSDWHIGRFLNGFSLLDDQAHFLNWLLSVLKNEKIDVLLVAGDIYNSVTPSAVAVSLLDEFLTKVVLELKIKVVLISGNHDSAEKLSFSSKILNKSGLFLAGGFKGFQCLKFDFDCGKVQIFLLPFFNYAQVKENFNLSRDCDEELVFKSIFKGYDLENLQGDFNLLCAHGLFVDSGYNLSYCDSEIVVGGSEAFNLKYFKKFDYVALGHLHGPQKAGSNGFYSGSPIKYSVSEANHKKRVVIVDFKKDGGVEFNEIFVEPLRDLKVVKGQFADLIKLKSSDYVSIQLTDKNFILGLYGKLSENYSNIVEIKFVNLNLNQVSEINKVEVKSPESLFKKFYFSVVGREMNSVELQIFSEVVKEIKDEINKT